MLRSFSSVQRHPFRARTELQFPAAHLIDGGGGVRGHMKLVESDLGVWQLVDNPADVGGPNVDSHRRDLRGLAVVCTEVRREGLDRRGIVPLDNEDHAVALLVGKRAHVVVVFGARGIVDRQTVDLREILGTHRRLDGSHSAMTRWTDTSVSRETAPKGISRYKSSTNASSSGVKPESLPAHGRLIWRTSASGSFTRGMRTSGSHARLEEVQVPIKLRHVVMHRVLGRDSRYGKAAADLEVRADVELSAPLIEGHAGDGPT